MIFEFLKRSLFYIAYGIIILSLGFGIWFMYTTVYAPLFITETADAISKQYVLPTGAIDQAQNLLQAKSQTTDDVTSLPNPFTATTSGSVIPPITASAPGIQVGSQP